MPNPTKEAGTIGIENVYRHPQKWDYGILQIDNSWDTSQISQRMVDLGKQGYEFVSSEQRIGSADSAILLFFKKPVMEMAP